MTSNGMPQTTEAAKKKLEDRKTFIIANKPGNNTIPTYIEQLAPSTDAPKIKYFNRMNQSIKNEFKKTQDIHDTRIKLAAEGSTNSGSKGGTEWHNKIGKYIDQPQEANQVGKAVIDALKTRWPGIQFLQSEFPLYGYMVHNEDFEISFWNGKVDAIGWYNNNYVIVDWKVVELLEFWDRNKHAYGKYLHQCLVYAKLLMLHLDLTKLPNILIVPIDHITGTDIHPALFQDFPDDCKEELNQYTWDDKEPKRQTLSLTRNMVISAINKLKESKNGPVLNNCTEDELLEALGFEKETAE